MKVLNIIFEETNDNVIYYIYDASNNVIGLKYNDDIYYYGKNIQNNITGIMDDSFNLLATYEYDSWGNIKSIKDTNGDTITDSTNIALVNPFRYRSYYYDSEIGMYYLNSRYYNSEWGRFINADGILNEEKSSLGNNVFAYCNNNYINYSDYNGKLGVSMKDLNTFISKTYTKIVMKIAVTVASMVMGKPLAGKLLNSSIKIGSSGKNGVSNNIKNLIVEQASESKEISQLIYNSISTSNGKNFNTGLTSIEFTTGDLYYGIQHANIKAMGINNGDGSWTVSIYMDDVYDFTEERTGNSFGIYANNFGYKMQKSGMISPYSWDVNFDMEFR